MKYKTMKEIEERKAQILKEMESATDERKAVLMDEMLNMGESLGEAYIKTRRTAGFFGCYGAWDW